jgi:hypothetical protein
MVQQIKAAIETWKQANKDAQEAENLLAMEWERFYSLGGKPPKPKLVTETAVLRSRANDALSAAMAVIDAARPPRPPDMPG